MGSMYNSWSAVVFVVLNIQELLGDGDKTFILLFPVSIFPSFIQVTFKVLLLPFSEHTWCILRGESR